MISKVPRRIGAITWVPVSTILLVVELLAELWALLAACSPGVVLLHDVELLNEPAP